MRTSIRSEMATSVPLIRNLQLDLGDVPRHWHGGRRSVTTFFDNLSLFFPAGERFFISAVNAHRRRIEEPALREAVRAFAAQEGFHGREHVRYNRHLAEQGYPVAAMEGRVERLLARLERRLPARWRLAATCALEHFTALMAHLLLSNPALLEGAHPAMRQLWRWHAAEENEHKAVAFDVYVAARGPWLERSLIMVAATVIFWAKVLEHQVRLMRVDGTLTDAGEWLALGRFLLWKPGGFAGLFRHYLDYYRPGFHPWDLDNRALLDAWKQEYEHLSSTAV
jgi:predicted metal-dependent hydrolase